MSIKVISPFNRSRLECENMENKIQFNQLLYKTIVLTCLCVMNLYISVASAAVCEHTIVSEWNNGFVATIRITNDQNTSIGNWSVSWGYDNAVINTSWSANISGSNPYTATAVHWNQLIHPGQTVEFGFVGSKTVPNTAITKPTLGGSVCEPRPTPTPNPSPSLGPDLCGDTWEALTVSGLVNDDQIEISWNAGWSGNYIGPIGNTVITDHFFGYCGPLGTFPPLELIITDDAGYSCIIDRPAAFTTTITCSKVVTPTPTLGPSPTPVA